MTYDFAVTEARRRRAELGKDYAIVYSEQFSGPDAYMVIPLQDAIARDLLIVERVTAEHIQNV